MLAINDESNPPDNNTPNGTSDIICSDTALINFSRIFFKFGSLVGIYDNSLYHFDINQS